MKGLLLLALGSMGMQSNSFGAAFQPLGDLPGSNYFSVATSVSADGRFVAGYSLSTNGYQAFRWTATGGMVALGVLPGGVFKSFANAISADGSTVVGYSGWVQGDQAFRWTPSEGMVGLGDLPGGSFGSVANGVSGDGSVIVGYSSSMRSTSARSEAFRWTAANGMEALGDLPGGNFDSRAFAVSADGSTIVGESSSSNAPVVEAFRWTAANGMVGLGDFPGGVTNSNAYGVSADGSVVVGNGYPLSNVHEAFRWSAGTGMVGLGFLPCDTWTIARAVSGNGSVIVGDPQISACRCVFIWDAQHGIRDLLSVLTNDYCLNLAGWQLCRATGLSFDGKIIVGYGLNPSGNTEAWIAHLPPPSLAVRRAGDNVVLSWPTNAPEFTLQSTTNLLQSLAWTNVADVPGVIGTEFIVTHIATNSGQFFRLRKP
jgi:probable HAF family extracellular repeat protein